MRVFACVSVSVRPCLLSVCFWLCMHVLVSVYICMYLSVQTIADSYSQFDGFVVVMGTDTMAYASSALSFMLENLSKPVIFTG